jgi:hypothetical protein
LPIVVDPCEFSGPVGGGRTPAVWAELIASQQWLRTV